MAPSQTAAALAPTEMRGFLVGLKNAFSFPVVLGMLLVAASFVCSRVFFIEGDTWLHILLGRDILATRSFPATDAYSFTARAAPPWHSNGWVRS